MKESRVNEDKTKVTPRLVMISRHISIDEKYMNKMKPYIDKYNGNLGAALREMINKVEIYDNRANSLYLSLFDWMLKEADGRIPPDNVIDEMIDPSLINSIERLREYINNRFDKLRWNVKIDIKSDTDKLPSYILVEIRGPFQKINVIASILSKYLIRHSSESAPLGIESVVSLNECIRVRLSIMDKNKSYESLFLYFGYKDKILKAVKDKPYFWKTIMEQHTYSSYNMVTIHRNYFEDLLSDNIPIGDIMLDILAKKPIQDIPLNELLLYIKDIYENSRIVDTIEIYNNDMIIYHGYRNPKSIEKLKKILTNLLENSGHLYDTKLTSNGIIFRYRPDIDMKISQIIDNLKMSKSGVDQELTMFMTFLNGLKDIPEISSSFVFLGKDIGRSLMQEYEKENNINHKDWDIEKFKNALQTIDQKFHRKSEWKIDNSDIYYIVKKCNIAKIDNKINPYICSAIREMFKGSLNYVFGDNARLDVRKFASNKDNFCEVILKTK